MPDEGAECLPAVGAVFGRHPRGIDFQSPDGHPTKLFFLLVAPEGNGTQHLKVLARVSLLLKDGASRDQLLAARDRLELYRCICRKDDDH